MRRASALAIAVALVVAVPMTARGQRAIEETFLDLGDDVFWSGPSVRGDGETFAYRLRLAPGGGRFRVALQNADPNKGLFGFQIESPNGSVSSERIPFWSDETVFPQPDPGIWTIVVRARNFELSTFRLRAKLEPPVSVTRPKALRPNLGMEPPSELTFDTPRPFVGAPFPMPSAHSCNADETAEQGATRCLRFSLGLENRGPGPLQLRFTPLADAGGEAAVYQRIERSDGSFEERRVGSYEWHPTHLHYHFAGFVDLELVRVVDRRAGRLEELGVTNKLGYCLADMRMNSWYRFIHQAAYSAESNCSSFEESWLGLSSGWTDIYTWDTPDNYVDFSGQPDGLYVVRARVDRTDVVIEANDTDNDSYVFIEVTGNEIKVLEQGHGRDPWDPRKRMVREWWRPILESSRP